MWLESELAIQLGQQESWTRWVVIPGMSVHLSMLSGRRSSVFSHAANIGYSLPQQCCTKQFSKEASSSPLSLKRGKVPTAQLHCVWWVLNFETIPWISNNYLQTKPFCSHSWCSMYKGHSHACRHGHSAPLRRLWRNRKMNKCHLK